MGELRGKTTGRTYRASKEIGSGAEGSIYTIVGDSTRVMKIYHDPNLQQIAKLTRMVESDLKHSIDVSFPEELIFEDGVFRGYVMKRVNGESFPRVYEMSSNTKPVPFDVRFTIAKNLCIALSNVHEAGFVFGDFNPANIKVDIRRRTVTLMDTDSFIFDSYGGRMARPEVVPKEIRDAMRGNESLPEGRKRDLPFTRESDIYSLAVHLFRLLMYGQHPFTYKPTRPLAHQPMYAYDLDPPVFPYVHNRLDIAPAPHAIPLESIPLGLQTLFVRMFREGYSDPSVRPGIREFLAEIEYYESSSVRCRANPLHMYHDELSVCPFCEADRRHGQALKGIVPEVVPVSRAEYVFNIDYDYILAHPDRLPVLKRTAASGSSESLLTLGRLYSDGVIEEQSDRKAVENFLKASMCRRPSAEAQYRLGLCFLDGIGVPSSKTDAVKWLTQSAESGYGPAKDLLEYIDQLEPLPSQIPITVETVTTEDVPDVKVSDRQIEVPKRTRRSPQQKCIDDVVSGDRAALARLHGFVMNGKIDWNSTESVHAPFKEAAQDSPELAFMYHEIMDKVGDPDGSEKYLMISANLGHVPALLRLGERDRLRGDRRGSLEWYNKAKAIYDFILIPEDLFTVPDDPVMDPDDVIIETLPIERPSRLRGGLSSIIGKIKGFWGSRRS